MGTGGGGKSQRASLDLHTDCTPESGCNATNLRVYAGLAAAALKGHQTAAYGIWTLARSIDRTGGGWVLDSDLRSAAAALADWDDRKYRRARADAVGLGLIIVADGRLYLCSLENAAYRLGAQRIGHTPIGVDVRTLAKVKTWRAALRDSFLAGQRPNPISQKTIQVATGLTPRTQYSYSKMNRRAVRVIHNFARVQKRFTPAFFERTKEFIPGAYLKGGDLWTQLGNTYDVDDNAYRRLRPGRTRRAQSGLNVLVNDGAGERTTRPARMYYETRQAASDTLKRIGRGKLAMPERVYVLARAPQTTPAAPDRQSFALWVAV